jgi:leucyl-tRNA synthetase
MEIKNIESKWQKKWEESKLFEVEKNEKPKFYVLEMFPYPSGSGLHVGHAFNYTIGDAIARFKLMNGFNVLHPMGYDSFGLPAENAAIKEGTHPDKYTQKSIKNFILQQKRLGLTFDWSRMVITSTPEFYKWDQWIFCQMYKKGLAYRKKSPINWCPKCNTVLANEQVQNGKCWRHEDTSVEIKHLTQWYFKTTQYAEELNNQEKIQEWPELVKKLQKNWIGKSYGTEVVFRINNEDWKVFTTRPDTLMGVTFLVVSAQHTRLMDLVTKENKNKVEEFVQKLTSVSEEEIDQLEKEGIFTGSYAVHPITGEQVPVFAGNFVLADYGCGMVMAVPAHDQRDFEFAKKYNIPMKVVITANRKQNIEELKMAYTDSGILINSGKFDGLDNIKAKEEITKELEKINKGNKTVNFKLRDWLISRQRYWGTPIPIIYCEKCGEVLDENLPITLPMDVKFGEGNPLTTSESFVNVKCPKCNSVAKRETDTMDTFVNSSWYNLRYADANNSNEIFNKDKVNYWNPIDLYIGGKEHACMHLIYVRFYTKFLRDLGLLNFDEPAIKMFNQGMIQGADGNKMSKSKGNTVDVTEIIDRCGSDALRMYLVSVAGPESDFNWNDRGLDSIAKFLNKVQDYFEKVKVGNSQAKKDHKVHSTLKDVTVLIEKMRFNLAIIKLRELFDYFGGEESKENLGIFVKMLSPFCPHLAEEFWEQLGNKEFVSNASWPKVVESKINSEFDFEDKYVASIKSDIESVKNLVKIEKITSLKLIIAHKWKYDLYSMLKEILAEVSNPAEIIPRIMNSELKQYGQEIMKIVPKIVKTKTVPDFISRDKEENILKQLNLDCKVEIIFAEDSQETKAKNAMPGKPSILIE